MHHLYQILRELKTLLLGGDHFLTLIFTHFIYLNNNYKSWPFLGYLFPHQYQQTSKAASL